jgi:hypothetical protein
MQKNHPSNLFSDFKYKRTGWLIPCIASVVLIVYLLPLFLQGQDSYITIHDNLDGIVANRVLLANSGHILDRTGEDIVPQIMNGLYRSYMASGLNIVYLLYWLLPPFVALEINYLIVHMVAFIGMGLLLNYLFTPLLNIEDVQKKIVIWGVALAYSVLPFYDIYGLTIAGWPLLFYAFLNVFEHKADFRHYLILLIIPFYSNFLLNGIFTVICLLIVFLFFQIRPNPIYGLWQGKPGKTNSHPVFRFDFKGGGILIAFSLVYMLTEYDFIRTVLFNPDFESHRSIWNLAFISYPLLGSIKNILSMFAFGQYHASSLHTWLMGVSFICLIFCWKSEKKISRIIAILLGVQLFIASIYGIYFWNALIPLKEKFGFFSSFNFGRIHWISPPIWYVIFAFTLLLVMVNKKYSTSVKKILCLFLLVVQIGINIAYNANFGHYVSKVFNLPGFLNEGITYRQFYSEDLFKEIKDYIGLPQAEYRVASIGIHPSISQFNGFYTLDSYQSNYELSYKERFREIIAPELLKSSTYQAYFDYWGSRCYIFSSELSGYLYTKAQDASISHLDINLVAFKNMGGRYILSSVRIENANQIGLKLLQKFESSTAAWRIYLYEAQ